MMQDFTQSLLFYFSNLINIPRTNRISGDKFTAPRPTPHLNALLMETEETDEYFKNFDESISGEESNGDQE